MLHDVKRHRRVLFLFALGVGSGIARLTRPKKHRSRHAAKPVPNIELQAFSRQWGFVDSSSAVEDVVDRVVSIAPGGVWLNNNTLEERRVQKHEKSLQLHSLAEDKKYGFYLHTFAMAPECIHLLREVRRVYRDAPVYITSDGGVVFSAICKRIGNCKFQWRPPANDHWNPYPFFNRFREATRWLDTKFVILLEPDADVHPSVVINPKPIKDDPLDLFSKDMVDYIQSEGKKASENPDYTVNWAHSGLAGGTFFSAQSVLDAFNPDIINWHKLRSLDSNRVWSSDVAMVLAFALKGYRFFPWDEVSEKRLGISDQSILDHYGREQMELIIHEEFGDMGLITLPDQAPGRVTCKGCVWVPDEECLLHKPIACPVGLDDSGPLWGNRESL